MPGVRRVAPQRFVWHVCSRSDAKTRASIERFGLLPGFSQYDCVFANNQSEHLARFFPFALYGVSEPEMYTGIYVAPAYDIWRIDTDLCAARWYVDPNMLDERQRGGPYWYICTRQSIPPVALRRYRVLPTWEQRFLVRWGAGLASFVGPRMQLAPYPFSEEGMLPILERAA
jgi:hypothetical protein